MFYVFTLFVRSWLTISDENVATQYLVHGEPKVNSFTQNITRLLFNLLSNREIGRSLLCV